MPDHTHDAGTVWTMQGLIDHLREQHPAVPLTSGGQVAAAYASAAHVAEHPEVWPRYTTADWCPTAHEHAVIVRDSRTGDILAKCPDGTAAQRIADALALADRTLRHHIWSSGDIEDVVIEAMGGGTGNPLTREIAAAVYEAGRVADGA